LAEIIEMIWKNIKLIFISTLCLYSCTRGQNQTTASPSKSDVFNNVTAIATINIKSFTERPYYSVDFDNSNSGCQFEILVNDIPVAKKIGVKGAITSSSPINSCILRTGKQKITVKLYPNLGKSNITTSAKNTSPITLSITYRRDAWEDKDVSEVTVFRLPEITIPAAGIAHFEREFDFEAKVPYEFQGWGMSKDLTKIPDIERKVMDRFRAFKALLEAKDYNAFAKMKKQKDVEMNTSFFLRPKEIKEGDDFDRMAFTEKDAEVQPFDNVKVTFYGYGKLVTLENIADKGSALRTKIRHLYADGKVKEELIKFPILLHLPQHSDKLEIIR
jgi:hypothetical protein